VHVTQHGLVLARVRRGAGVYQQRVAVVVHQKAAPLVGEHLRVVLVPFDFWLGLAVHEHLQPDRVSLARLHVLQVAQDLRSTGVLDAGHVRRRVLLDEELRAGARLAQVVADEDRVEAGVLWVGLAD